MKNLYLIACFIFCFFVTGSRLCAQTNHITISLQGCAQPTGNTLEFDIMVKSDGSAGSDLRANAFQFGVNFNTAILQTGATITTSYITGSSDFIPLLSGFTFPASAYADHIRIIESAYTGGNTGNTMILGHWYKAGRFSVTSSQNWTGASNPNFNLQDTVVAGKTSCGAVVWIGNSSNVSSAPYSLSVSCGITLNCTSCPPHAAFTSSDTIICNGGGCVSFTDNSLNSPNSWQWYFPGATPSSSNLQNPTNICYSSTGTYGVMLIASNGFGSDTLSVSPVITVSNSPLSATITLTGGDTLVCSGSGGSYFQWYVDTIPVAGATDSFYVANAAGYYKVRVSNLSGCSTFSNVINITTSCNLAIGINNVHNASCATCTDGHATVYASNGTAPYAYTWYTSPLQNSASATGLTPGNYNVCAIDANGCTACTTVHIDSINCPVLYLNTSVVNTSCITCSSGTATAVASGGTAPYTYSWNTIPVQATATAAGLSKGTYAVCATDFHGCTVCGSAIVGLGHCRSNFNLYPDTIAHNYIAVNTATGTPPITYVWSWGDGGTDTAAYPNHTYSSAGNYTLCLSITDNVGCTSDTCEAYFLLRKEDAMIFVQVVPQIITEVSNLNANLHIMIYPNPVKDVFTIYGLRFTVGAMITVYNVLGEKVYSAKPEAGSNKPETVLNVSSLEKGVYFIEIKNDDVNVVAKFIKQ